MTSLPPSHGRAIDHVVILVQELAAAAAAMQAIGFEVQPQGGHPLLGTVNRTIMLDHSYLELLAVARPALGNLGQRALIERGGGLRGVALATSDLPATVRRLQASGLHFGAPQRFERPVGNAQARFATVKLATGDAVDGYLFFCEHGTPELVWLPGSSVHPNGATRLLSVRLRQSGGDAAVDFAALAEPATAGPLPSLGPTARIVIETHDPPREEQWRTGGFARFADGWRHPALGDMAIELSTPPR